MEESIKVNKELIRILEKMKKVNPSQKITAETSKGTVSFEIGNSMIYEGSNGSIVIDSE